MLLSVLMFLSGCNEIPTIEEATTYASKIGKYAGIVYVIQHGTTENTMLKHVDSIISEVLDVIPSESEKFEVKWTPVINDKIAKLLSENKIDSTKAMILTKINPFFTKSLDWIFEKKLSKVKTDVNYIKTVVQKFIDGFKSVITGNTAISTDEKFDAEFNVLQNYLTK